ncbi:hypothetical protein L9F63_016554, partial [Diploptera punctata]
LFNQYFYYIKYLMIISNDQEFQLILLSGYISLTTDANLQNYLPFMCLDNDSAVITRRLQDSRTPFKPPGVSRITSHTAIMPIQKCWPTSLHESIKKHFSIMECLSFSFDM